MAPDYILCDIRVKNRLIEELIRQIRAQFGERPLENKNYGRIINEKHFLRILNLMDPAKTVFGGRTSSETLQIEPTLLDNITWQDDVMQEEIFGPVLPILTYDSIDDVIRLVNEKPHPLALYLFTRNRKLAHKVLTLCSFGGGCVNDTIIHLARPIWASADSERAAWAAITGRPDLIPFLISKVLWIRGTGRIFPCGISPIQKERRSSFECFSDSIR